MIWLAVLAGLYLAVVVLLTLLQDRIVFPIAGRGERPLDPGSPVRTFTLQREGGHGFRVAEYAPAQPAAVLLFFVGNGEDLRSGARWCEELAAYGLRVVVPEYPGYGGSEGQPSVDTFHAAAAAAADYAAAAAKAASVPLFAGGSSLGSFCACWVAARYPVQKLLLRAPPTSLAAAAGARFPWLPVRLLLRHRFDNLAETSAVHCAVLIVHGEADRVVPCAQGRALAAAFAPPARLLVVPGFGHDDLPLAATGPLGAEVSAFLAGR
jgi:pimeloyl-ACP methyl ester carboxylesterase